MMKKRVMAMTMGAVGLLAAVLPAYPAGAQEAGTAALPDRDCGGDIISVVLPSVSEGGDSPFDFYLDPQGLIYETDAARHGGGSVEEGATVLFHNCGGEYDYSGRSDRLEIKNRSSVPVVVTITAGITDPGGIEMAESPDFGGSGACSMYLALVDDEGNEQAVPGSGTVSVSAVLREAPEGAYVYRIEEETGSCSYELSAPADEIDFDAYSFGLTGCCNPDGDWQGISVHPSVNVTWKVDPVIPETGEQAEDAAPSALPEGGADAGNVSDGPEADTGTGTGTEAETGTDTEADTGTERETEAETGTETVTDTGTETEAEAGTNTGTETGIDTGIDTGTETGIDTGTNTGTETGTDTGTDTGTGTGTDTEAGTETGTETEAATGTKVPE